VAVHQANGGRAFAYRGSDPFDRSVAHVTIVTWPAHLAMYSAVCPAELPPPATKTFRPRMAGASLAAAP